jgi:WD40 repeat protein
MVLKDVRGESISFAPQANEILVARGNAITRWNLDTGSKLGRIPISHEPRRLEISFNGELFATVNSDSTSEIVTLSDTASGEQKASWTFSDFVGDLHWHPGGKWIAVADYSGKVQLLDCQTGDLKVLGRHKVQAVTVAFSPNGDYLVSGGWEREMICWNLRTLTPAFTIDLDSYHLQFSADGRRCATFVRSRTVPGAIEEFKLHAFEQPVAVREFAEDLGNRLEQAVFSPDERWLAASGQQRVGLWDLTTQQGPGALIDSPAMRLSFAPDGMELFGSGLDGECRRWRITAAGQLATGPQLRPLPTPPTNGFISVCLVSNLVVWTSPAGSRIASVDDPGVDGSWTPTSAGLNGVSPDGRWLAIFRRFSPYLHIYRLPGLELVAVLTNRANILACNFSPQGDEIAIAAPPRLEFWNTTTWQRMRELTDYRGIIYQPHARALWLTKNLRTAGLFDARMLESLLPLPTGMLPLALSPDGRRLAVSVDSRKLQVWDVPEVRRQLASLGLDWRD